MTEIRNLCLLGFGEVGTLLAADLLLNPQVNLRIWDRLFADAHSRPSRCMGGIADERVVAAPDAASAARGCELVISAVTADQDLAAAESVLPAMEPGTWFLDLNSVSPATKSSVAERIQAAGGRYVEAAVMSPIAPRRIETAILLGGPHTREFLPLGRALGFAGMAFCSERLGQAAATKMCRSVIVKGMEALLTESLLAARFYGVEDSVVNSLHDLFPRPDWPAHARYMISRSLEHGARRSEEMREVAKTVAEAGLEPWMSRGCVERQAWAATHAEALRYDALGEMLAAIRQRMEYPVTEQQ